MSTITAFAELFEGRFDAYGTEDGGAERVPDGDEGEYIARILRHLNGTAPIGTYLLDGQGDTVKCRWGCVDFDEGEAASWAYALNLQTILAEFDVDAWVERSRSKGYHVWIFLTAWTPARLVREALLAACQMVGSPIKEVNPKQIELEYDDELDRERLGNYVRLPYPGAMAADGEALRLDARRVVVDDDGVPYTLEEFVIGASESRTPPEKLEALAALYAPPVRIQPVAPIVPSDGSRPAVRRLSGLAFTIYEQGPYQGGDRSDTLFKLARLMREEGELTHGEALDLLRDADSRWGKFVARGASGERSLRQLLDKAWA
jgi:hypothetical protein